MLPLSNQFLIFHIFWDILQDNMFHDPSGHKYEAYWLFGTGVLLFTLLKMIMIFLFTQSLKSLPDCHNFSNMMECGRTIPSANYLRTLRCNFSCLLSLCMFSFLMPSQIWFSLMLSDFIHTILFPQSLKIRNLRVGRENTIVRWEKNLLSTSAFSMLLVACSHYLRRGGTNSLLFLLWPCTWPHPSPISTSTVLYFSLSYLYTSRQCPYILPRKQIPVHYLTL